MMLDELKERIASLTPEEWQPLLLFLTLSLRNMIEPQGAFELSTEHVRAPDGELFARLGLQELRRRMFAYGTVYDWHESETDRPFVELRYLDGTMEKIDILNSVKANASSIGHPAILQAIKRWEQILILHHAKRTEEPYKRAKRHLEQIGKALWDGAHDRGLDAAEAFHVSSILLASSHDSLTKVWKLLGQGSMKNANRKLDAVKKLFLDREQWNELKEIFDADEMEALDEHIQNKWHEIKEFLEDDNAGGGIHFLGNRRRLRTFLGAFDRWRLNLNASSIRTYRSRMRSPKKTLAHISKALPTGALDPQEHRGNFCLSDMAHWLRLPVKSESIDESWPYRLLVSEMFAVHAGRGVD